MTEPRTTRAQVGIVGAGPAGLVLAHLLQLQGIEAVVLETRSREYVEHRVRAGVLEHGTVDLLVSMGVGDRLRREGLVQHGIELRFDGHGHRIPLDDLTGGRGIAIYGQQEVVKDLIAARLRVGAPLLFGVEEVTLDDVLTRRPVIRFRHGGVEHELRCGFIAGCDGFHGISRDSLPDGALTVHSREFPFAWFGVLVEAPPAADELIYCYSDRGFALHSMRSPTLSRLYFQCSPTEDPGAWSDDEIWRELRGRLARDDGWTLNDGPIVEKGVTPMRSFVAEPMQYGRLFLAGDAVHIVPPTGAKGLNLAVADVRVLAKALVRFYERGDESLLDTHSTACLKRVWRAQHFVWWMTEMLHRFPGDEGGFRAKLQRAQLEYVCSSRAAAATLAENYVGIDGIGVHSHQIF